MTAETHPVVRVVQSVVDGKPQYQLMLSRANFNYLCAGCPDIDRLVGQADNGLMFCIFENPHGNMPNSFRPLPSRDGYFASVGAPVPRIPQGVTNEEFARLSQQACDNLELAINNSGRIPIEEETGLGIVNLGYVVMEVEKAN